MSEYYGMLTGSRGKTVNRCGHKNSGMKAVAKSWATRVVTYYYYLHGETYVDIYVEQEGTGKSKVLFSGKEVELIDKMFGE